MKSPKVNNVKKLVPTTINLPKEWADHLTLLKKETGKSKDFYVRKCLEKYLEDQEDLQIGLKILKSKGKIYSSEEANQRLRELSAKSPKSSVKHV